MTAPIKKPKTPEQKAAAVEAQKRYRAKKKAAADLTVGEMTVDEIVAAVAEFRAAVQDDFGAETDSGIQQTAEEPAVLKIQSQDIGEFVAPPDPSELTVQEVDDSRQQQEVDDSRQQQEVDDDTAGIRFSIGTNAYDNLPVQYVAPDFDAMRETLLVTVSPHKGMAFFCAPFAAGPHDKPEKYPDEKPWRLKKLTLPRSWISFDADAFGYPDDETGEAATAAECCASFLARAEAFKGFAHTTASHTDERPRLRLTLATSRPVTRAEGEALGKALEIALAPTGGVLFDPSVYRGEQPCYLPVQADDKPPFKAWRFDGVEVNPDDYLAGFVEPAEAEAREVVDWSPDEASRAESALLAIPNDLARPEWFKLLSAAKEAGVSKEAAEQWSNTYDYGDARKATAAEREFPYQWASITVGKAGGVSADFLFTEARKHGWQDPILAALFADVGEAVPAAEILAAVDLLAKYDDLDYQTHRKLAAKKYKISVATMDKLVSDKRKELAAAAAVADAAVVGPTADWIDKGLVFTPLNAPVDGAVLLAALVAIIRRFVFCSEHVALAEAAWAMLTWMQAELDLMPRLGGMAPAKRCGKTRNQEVLHHLVFNPLAAVNLSTAVVYRIIAKGEVTLMLDEVDTWLSHENANPELIGIVNAGHSRNGVAWRVNPETLEVESYQCFAPAALAGIGRLPPTVTDRCIPVLLKRKLMGEQADKLKREQKKEFTPLRAQIHRWITDNRAAVANLVQSGKCTIELGNDRAEENWEPLLALAAQVGKEWYEKMKAAALVLEANGGDEGGDHLLEDIREVLATNPSPYSTQGSTGFAGTGRVVQDGHVVVATLAAALRQSYGWKKLTPRGLGNMLKSYEIRSEAGRVGDKPVACYSAIKLRIVFDRYLKPEEKVEEEKKPKK